MRTGLAVSLDDGRSSRVVTADVSDLSFTKTAPGGHHSASCTVNRSLADLGRLGPVGKLRISDMRTGKYIWSGFTNNPGGTGGTAGQSFRITANGGIALANDGGQPVVFIDRSLDDALWVEGDTTALSGSVDTVSNRLRLAFSAGSPVGPSSRISRIYMGLRRAGQRLLVAESGTIAGRTDDGYALQAITIQAPNNAGETVWQAPFRPSNQIMSTGLASAAFPIGRDALMVRAIRLGAETNVTDDTAWGWFDGPYIRPILKDVAGNDVLAGLSYAVRPHEVIGHVFGALMPNVRATRVDPSDTLIYQLAYHSGAKPMTILDEMSVYEADFLWEILGEQPDGRYEARWRRWDTDPRYEVSVDDGYQAPGGDVDLCNRILVTWTDALGQKQNTVVTSTVPELDQAGRIRDADPIDLPEGRGSEVLANQLGQQVLTAKNTPTGDGQVTVAHPIRDRYSSTFIQPWEIEPGYPVLVRETGDLLRMTQMVYAHTDQTSTLTLGTPIRTLEQILARYRSS